ncbi:reverse transcriptase domain-containing protein [Tanacetum coccineum]
MWAKEDNMIQYLDKTKSLIQSFDRFTIRQVPRGDNKKADALSKIASTSFAHLSKQVLVEILKNKSILDGDTPRESGKNGLFCDNIVDLFGLPGEIVSDNGKQFCDNPFKDWCTRLSITQRFASVKHPQTNGLVERANRSLGEGIKARLDRHKGRWVEELSHVLWAHRTTIKVSTGDTPFSLVYGTEAVIPAEIGMPTIRTARREQAAIREEKAKSQMKGYYDARVRRVSFRPGDFVYRANDQSPRRRHRKLWYQSMEGPYEVTEALGKGAYKLRDMEGRELPRTWNICNLKKCYL